MKVLNSMTIIVDTREQKNQHILDYLEHNKIPYIVRKLDSGDYSFILPDYPELNMDERVLVERKGSLSELAGNFTSGRERFAREFERLKDNQKMHLVLETGTWKKIFNGTYRSSFHPNSYKASILTWSARYNIPFWFCEKRESPEIIHKILIYELNELLDKI